MFDPGIVSNPSAKDQRESVHEAMRRAIDDGSFTYTELLSAEEPMRTYALEYLDGVKVQDNNLPIYGVNTVEHWSEQNGRHLLVHLEPAGHIKHEIRKDVRTAGTNKITRGPVMEDFGNIAYVTDAFGERFARNILFQQGWPVRQNTTSGNIAGTVIEWKWLQKEAALGSGAAHGVLELFEEVSKRVEAFEQAQAKKASDALNNKKSAKAANTQLGA